MRLQKNGKVVRRLAAFLFIVLAHVATAQTAADTRRQGSEFMGASTQAMQKDDALNPGMLWVNEGEALWRKPAGLTQKACVTCHAVASSSMKGVAARYPAFEEDIKRPVTLNQRINICRQKHQQAEPLRYESQDLLSLESYVAHQSRGMPVTPPSDTRLDSYRQQGLERYTQRIGLLNLSCAQCHDTHAGGKLGGSQIPQAHPTGYPLYRLEWQTLGSLQRRLRNCMTGVRAEPFAYGAAEFAELELYLAVRAKGMLIQTPGVRP
jgi:sulfur-oxidizing protein SoxA